MDFFILGPLKVEESGRAIPLGGPKQRALLAVLLLNANRSVSLDRLVDALWGERPPQTAATTIHVYVSQLRKVLGRERLVTQKPGYVLQVTPDELDLARFERLTVRARRADDPAERAGLLREALGLWRGAPFDDLAYEPFVAGEAAHLEEARLAALEERIDAELALGGSSELVAELERLVPLHPLRERLHSLLMVALYRSGRQADALSAYQDARTAFVEGLGLEPSRTIQELERQILNQDPALGQVDGLSEARVGPAETSGLREERKVVTVLFADLVGFTRRAEQLDPEDVRQLLRRFHEPIRAEIVRFGGTIEKFVGDAVMAVFGAPTAHEDDAERAVRAAFAIREAISALRTGDPELDLALRIGINTGSVLVALDADVVRGEGLVVGDVVNTAARLQAAAAVNAVVVGEATRRATERSIEYRKVAAVRAKGKTEPVPAWEALRERLPIGQRPSPIRRAPLVGRDADLAGLRETVAAVRGNQPRVVSLVGPPGIGKTRLVAELRAAEGSGLTWLVGRSLSYGDGLPFYALGQIVKTQTGILDTDSAESAMTKLAAALPDSLAEEASWIINHLRPLVGLGGEPTGDRREAFAAWRRFLEAIADQNPLVLVLEDVHWAGEGLLDFVEHLGSWARGALLVICTARPELLEARPDWDVLRLRPLSNDDAKQLLDALLSRSAVTAESMTAVVRGVSGNPLYIEEFARALAARSEGDVLPALPETIQGVIAARLDALPSPEKAVIHDAAVLGRVFSTGALAALALAQPDALVGRLGTLEQKEMVQLEARGPVGTDDEYAFVHVLVRDVAYGQIPRADRAERHRRAAEWMRSLSERTDNQVELIAYHYSSALELFRAAGRGADDLVDPTVEYLALAGERASQLHAYAEAIDYLQRALLLADDSPRSSQVLEVLGKALQITGRRADARATFERALALTSQDDAVRLSRLYRLLAGTLMSEYSFADATSAYERAQSALEPIAEDEGRWREWIQVQIDRLTLLYWQQDPQEMQLVIEEVEPIVERWGTAAQGAEFLASHFLARLLEERYVGSDETLGLSRRFLSAREALGDPGDIARARFNLGFVLVGRGELEDARAEIESALETADRTGNAILRCRCLTYLSTVHRRRSDVSETKRMAQEALDAATEMRMPEYIGMARANLAWVAWREQDLEGTEAQGNAALAAYADSVFGVFPWEWTARFPLLALALARGRVAEARDHARAMVAETQQPLGDPLEMALSRRGRKSLEQALALAEAAGRL
jgi:DNA-binding SARP family transcriptional activator